MKLVTWNVNSIRARAERVAAFLDRHQPDVLCLQELKTEEAAFPQEVFSSRGYHVVGQFQRTYNGVALASREPPTDVVRGLPDGGDDPQARLVMATVAGIRIINVYVPNGQEVGSDKWVYKLGWLRRLRRFLDSAVQPTDPVCVCGDFNVAPDERDVHDPAAWADSVLFHPEAREALRGVMGFGLKDALRVLHDQPGIYTWWDYRMLGFPKNHGLRIDLMLMTDPLAARCTSVVVDRDERKGKQPSDHAPVLATISP